MTEIELEEFDILPLGREESRPVNLVGGRGEPRDYPEALRLLAGIDAGLLFKEYSQCLKEIPQSLVAGREHLIWRGQTRTQVFASLAKLGFYKGAYAATAMRKPGECELRPEIGPHTREVLQRLGARTFRQQYVQASPFWRCAPHVDHYSFRVHGLRVHIPLNCVSNIVYPQQDGTENIYVMKPGEAWFLNTGRIHYAENPGMHARINIQVQMDSDRPVLQAMAGDV